MHRFITLLLILSAGAAMAAPLRIVDKITTLEEAGLYTVGYQLIGGQPMSLPNGWMGDEPVYGMSLRYTGQNDGRYTTSLHEPWMKGPGIGWQVFTVQLPKSGSMYLKGSAALSPITYTKSDGVQFTVQINGRQVWSYLSTSAKWKDFNINLAPYAGKAITIKFMNGPGPKNDTSFDGSMWGSRRIEVSQPGMLHVTANRKSDTKVLYAVSKSNNVLPAIGTGDGPAATSLTKTAAQFVVPHAGTKFVYKWKAANDDSVAGQLSVYEQGNEKDPIPLYVNSHFVFTDTAKLIDQSVQKRGSVIQWIRHFKVGNELAALSTDIQVRQHSLWLSWSCSKPVISLLNSGSLMPVMYRRQIPMPYLDIPVFYLRSQDLFSSVYLDWTASNASNFYGTMATYSPLTNGTRNCLRECAAVTVSPHIQAVLPSTPNPQSTYIKDVSKRMVLDFWGYRYQQIGDIMARQRQYGIDSTAAIIHAWQNMGYDNGLPLHYPANPGPGTDEELQQTVRRGVAAGARMMLHENYVDYYPNYPGFNTKHIMLNSDGSKVNAWYNEGTKIQSYAIKPDQMVPLAKAQSPEIHKRYGTNGMFLDVNSSVPPSWRVDMQAGCPEAGMTRAVGEQSAALWQFERESHEGPVFGEGNHHWYWSGLLDGAEAQFGIGWPGGQGMHAPLLVDFDLLRIHPLQANHGMGYITRWWNTADPNATASIDTLDMYRMQEVAYGHCGFVDTMLCDNLPYAWLEHHTMTPISAATAAQLPKDISYLVDGSKWVGSDIAAKQQQWDTVKVVYANGVTIAANRAAKPVRVGQDTLPQYGWSVHGKNLSAVSGIKNGVRYDDVQTPDSHFVNARHPKDWMFNNQADVLPSVASFKQTAQRAFNIVYQWKVDGNIPSDNAVLVHYTHDSAPNTEHIAFQSDYKPEMPTSQWAVGGTVYSPSIDVNIDDKIADGDYEIRIGLYNNTGRLILLGDKDSDSRVNIGTIHVRDHGQTITFTRHTSTLTQRTPSKGLNAKGTVVDFGDIKTDGSVLVRREGSNYVLRVMPTARPVQLSLKAAKWALGDRVNNEAVKEPVTVGSLQNGWRKLAVWGGDIISWPIQ